MFACRSKWTSTLHRYGVNRYWMKNDGDYPLRNKRSEILQESKQKASISHISNSFYCAKSNPHPFSSNIDERCNLLVHFLLLNIFYPFLRYFCMLFSCFFIPLGHTKYQILVTTLARSPTMTDRLYYWKFSTLGCTNGVSEGRSNTLSTVITLVSSLEPLKNYAEFG